MTCRNFRFDDCFDDCLEELLDRDASQRPAQKVGSPEIEELTAIAARSKVAPTRDAASSPTFWSAVRLRSVLWQAALVLLVAGLIVLVGLLTSSSLKHRSAVASFGALSARSSAHTSIPAPPQASCAIGDAALSAMQPAPLRRRVFCAFHFAVFADRRELEKALSQQRNP